MKYLITLLLVLATLLLGCKTTNKSGRTLATIATTVDSGMKAWATWVVSGKATPAQEESVKAAYKKYQVSMDLAVKAYVSVENNKDQSPFTTSVIALIDTRNSLLRLIKEFSGN